MASSILVRAFAGAAATAGLLALPVQAGTSVHLSIGIPAPVYYNSAPAPVYYSAPAPAYYRAPAPVYYYSAPAHVQYDYPSYGYGYVRPVPPAHYHGGRYRDRDRDGIPNRWDRDRDGDGVPNRYDRRPDNPYRY